MTSNINNTTATLSNINTATINSNINNIRNSTTNNMILDYLFYQSIQSRLQKAFTFDESVSDKNVIESVIDGILASKKKDAKFEQRLNLCQLTNLTIGRTHHVTFSAPSSSNNNISNNSNRRSLLSNHPTTHLFNNPFNSTFCRRHRRSNCSQSSCSNSKGGPGLAEAIPAFLKTSANMLRSVLDSEHNDVKPLMVAGQQVMGGGMPSRWYDLFLDLLTQAAIQSYMCDGKTGLETIYEIFSYGYVEDEDEEDNMDDYDEDDDDEEEDEEEDEEHDDIWSVKAADHHLLFPKTRTMFLFKLQVREREKEFIQIKQGYTLEKHFMELEKLYPLIYFEKNMCDFIQMLLEDMDIPALDKCDNLPEVTSPLKSPEDLPELQFSKSSMMPSLYKYPGDGSLLMPEIPDMILDENEEILIPINNCSNINHHNKRSAYTASLEEEDNQINNTSNKRAHN